MPVTVIQHVLNRLKDIGIADVFGVPGDYSFSVCDAVLADSQLRWVGCCNELNAGYAADGYARVKGAAALSTTYGVGELSAINAIAGSYAEHLPVFHLVGTPRMSVQAARAIMHHTLGDGEYGLFRRMSEPVVVAHAVMTPQNVAYETERLIHEALYHRRPVYMAFPADLAEQPVLGAAALLSSPASDPVALDSAAAAIIAALEQARTACLLPGILAARTGLSPLLQRLVDASGLPFATMAMDKSVLEEDQTAFVGMYDGAIMSESVGAFVEGCDRIITVGALMSDFNTGAFTARLDPAKTIAIGHHRTRIDGTVYQNVEMEELIGELTRRLVYRSWRNPDGMALHPAKEAAASGADAPITAEALYVRWGDFLRPGDQLVAETGTISMGLAFAALPKGATFHNQTLWGSIGWATPAAVGIAAAAPGRRTILVTGDGSHQLTAQEIGLFGRLGLKPVVFVLNNSGYLIERLLCRDSDAAYNNIAPWRYTELPQALGCEGWLTARVTTLGELDAALAKAGMACGGVYIEVVTGPYEASPLARKLHDSIATLYPK
ncbi:alpha-keto acid decarboxylase family protein [Bradyrhizobium canariense]|uniref:Indolepyruvate decarboxylase n=1 Tax=Bradyrhizobium canariense TaxID=255045 RepID=A0A1H1WME7_9BRAD|nr:thiamine pyrophosphate-binding protein [Bradyrhizobium canariense]SDS98488.1 indolepyruvate decarboxylase [Bradyrhizobium canariense]